jgi:hypothetical protein
MYWRSYYSSSHRQTGAAAVEFGFVAILFFTILLGIIEFGRFMYVWNTVQEVTRRGAREAVVRWVSESNSVAKLALFGGDTLPGASEIINYRNVSIQYLSADLYGVPATTPIPNSSLPSSAADNIAACLDSSRTQSCIRYVEVSVCKTSNEPCVPLPYKPMIGLFEFLNIDIPPSSVIMPAESLGYTPS